MPAVKWTFIWISGTPENFGLLFGKDGLPDQPVRLIVIMKPDGKGLAFQVNDSGLGKIQLQLDGRIVDLEQPLGMDGKFRYQPAQAQRHFVSAPRYAIARCALHGQGAARLDG